MIGDLSTPTVEHDPLREMLEHPSAITLEIERARRKVEQELFGAQDEVDEIPRYELGRRLGAGGAAVVFEAFDPQLQRRVAIKILRRGLQGSPERMIREGRALAQLAHPNVVGVYDIAQASDGVLYIVMELVDGQSLAEVIHRGVHNWKQKLDLLLAAGAGLSAVHEIGLLHRDFKPANVLVGHDGRVRVADFGLARADSDADFIGPPSPVSEAELDSMTVSGLVLGTPAYMAPEQHFGRPATVRSDQYSFACTTWEAIYGERPFPATRAIDELADLKLAGPPRPPGEPRIPSRISAALRRAMAPEPAERFEHLNDLLAELRRARRSSKTSVVVMCAVLVGAVGGAVAPLGNDGGASACTTVATQNAFGRSQAETLEALAEQAGGSAPQIAPRLIAALERHDEQLASVEVSLCERRQDGEFDVETIERGEWCLERAYDTVGALIDRIESGEVGFGRAIEVVSELEHPEDCASREALAHRPVPPPEAREGARVLSQQLARLQAGLELGEFSQTDEAAKLTSRAQELDWAPMVAQTQRIHCQLLEGQGRYDDAEERCTAAHFSAVRGGSWTQAASAASDLTSLAGYRRGDYRAGLLWSEHAAAMIARTVDPWNLLESDRLNAVGTVEATRGALDRAEEAFAESLALRREALGEEDPAVARAQSNLAQVQTMLGKYDDAIENGEQALELFEHAFGSSHPVIATVCTTLANAHSRGGASERGLALYRRALEVRSASLGDDHPDTIKARIQLATALSNLGEDVEGRTEFEAALEALAGRVGKDHPDYCIALGNFAAFLYNGGELQAAINVGREVIERRHEVLGDDHPHTALAHATLGSWLIESDPDGAAEHARAALEADAEGQGATAHCVLASVARKAGDLEEASRQDVLGGGCD